MGLLDEFLAEGHSPCYGNRAVWGAATPVVTDFIHDPDGHGWHLDRARFDGWLRLVAVARGARLLAPARLNAIRRGDRCWNVQLALEEGGFEPSVPLAKEWVLWRSCRDVLPMPEMPQFDAPGILGSACPWKPRLILNRHLPCAGGSAVGIHTATLPAATPFLADRRIILQCARIKRSRLTPIDFKAAMIDAG
jgi:hypothetical protein